MTIRFCGDPTKIVCQTQTSESLAQTKNGEIIWFGAFRYSPSRLIKGREKQSQAIELRK